MVEHSKKIQPKSKTPNRVNDGHTTEPLSPVRRESKQNTARQKPPSYEQTHADELGEALRANLAKRKAQFRARQAEPTPEERAMDHRADVGRDKADPMG